MNLQQGMHGAGREGGGAGLNNQQGIALLTVMLMLLILTILGIASIGDQHGESNGGIFPHDRGCGSGCRFV